MTADVDAKALLQAAKQASALSYSPYSRFAVGAALQLSDGTVVTGTNIENASYGLTVCAERVALFKAASEGLLARHRPVALAVWATSVSADAVGSMTNSQPHGHVTPCGACRQVMAELMPDGQVPVIWADPETGQPVAMPVGQLMPFAFGSTGQSAF